MGLRARLAGQSAVVFAIRIGGAGLVFLLQALIARLWGAASLSEFQLAIAAANLMAVAMPLGFQSVAAYLAARYFALGERAALRAFLRRAYLHIAAAALLLVLATPLLAANPAFAALAAGWPPLALMAIATATVYVNGAVLIGLKRPILGLVADGLIRPMLLLLGLLAALGFGVGPDSGVVTTLWCAAGVYAAVALVQLRLVWRSVGAAPDVTAMDPHESRLWWRYAVPWLAIGLATDFFFDIDLIVLSVFMDRETLAIFGVALRLFALAAFAVGTLYALSIPHLVDSTAQPDREQLHRRLGDANLASLGLACAFCVAALVAGPFAFAVFGPQFEAGSGPLAVMGLALAVRAAFGPASIILSLHDRPYASLPSVAAGLATLVLFNATLVPSLGLWGASFAVLGSLSVWSGLQWHAAKRIAGMDVSVWPRLARLVAPRGKPLIAPPVR